ncbi:hypothetical protein MYCTH_2138805 [Thermothelomyces thermophilus ATCC 42464]|uniref:C2H2-type domain-containing protein n=1 Tax=Thermothelomyces thermophilus (strain ATCC 42464 / BCRC 31852 / DSM 1799) TaxID=573729 RepID=G2QCP9_THET4|nr:uncharacterized protein MYCTH_2138805 [Thermothelomyces thermophilus ATCC 42464]AEO57372.1 hypothetical protein MYCTH_2138805 [Thermothelomyces thermophilus ATCC 42464]
MERAAPEYSQSDPASAAQYATQPEARSASYSNSATPTSEYSVYPTTSRSATFPDMQRSYHPASNPPGSGGGMPQTPTSPSMPLPDGRSHQNPQPEQAKSDSALPIDPSIAGASPTYATHSQYPPYAAPPPDMSQGYQHPGTPGLYTQPRPDWGGYGQQPASSFVPIPGAQQHKRPRRRYEEIERMYKCGYNGCEKAYGTLNHLNAHVTMQGHGAKRTPDLFKDIRREWKAKKKEEEARKAAAAEEERQRQAAAAAAAAAAAQNGGNTDPQTGVEAAQPPTSYPGSGTVQLPPIGYQPARYAGPPPAGMQQPIPEYNNYPSYSPASPYGQSNQQMYNTHNGGQPPSH